MAEQKTEKDSKVIGQTVAEIVSDFGDPRDILVRDIFRGIITDLREKMDGRLNIADKDKHVGIIAQNKEQFLDAAVIFQQTINDARIPDETRVRSVDLYLEAMEKVFAKTNDFISFCFGSRFISDNRIDKVREKILKDFFRDRDHCFTRFKEIGTGEKIDREDERKEREAKYGRIASDFSSKLDDLKNIFEKEANGFLPEIDIDGSDIATLTETGGQTQRAGFAAPELDENRTAPAVATVDGEDGRQMQPMLYAAPDIVDAQLELAEQLAQAGLSDPFGIFKTFAERVDEGSRNDLLFYSTYVVTNYIMPSVIKFNDLLHQVNAARERKDLLVRAYREAVLKILDSSFSCLSDLYSLVPSFGEKHYGFKSDEYWDSKNEIFEKAAKALEKMNDLASSFLAQDEQALWVDNWQEEEAQKYSAIADECIAEQESFKEAKLRMDNASDAENVAGIEGATQVGEGSHHPDKDNVTGSAVGGEQAEEWPAYDAGGEGSVLELTDIIKLGREHEGRDSSGGIIGGRSVEGLTKGEEKKVDVFFLRNQEYFDLLEIKKKYGETSEEYIGAKRIFDGHNDERLQKHFAFMNNVDNKVIKNATISDRALIFGKKLFSSGAYLAGLRGIWEGGYGYWAHKKKTKETKERFRQLVNEIGTSIIGKSHVSKSGELESGFGKKIEAIEEMIADEENGLTDADRDQMMEKINYLLESFHYPERAEGEPGRVNVSPGQNESGLRMDALNETLENYVKSKISGIRLARETLNSVAVFGAAAAPVTAPLVFLMRGVTRILFDIATRVDKLITEDKRTRSDSFRKFSSSKKHETTNEVATMIKKQKEDKDLFVHRLFIGGLQETWDDLMMRDKTGDKTKTALSKTIGSAAALARIVSYLGIGATAINALSEADWGMFNWSLSEKSISFQNIADNYFGRTRKIIKSFFSDKPENISADQPAPAVRFIHRGKVDNRTAPNTGHFSGPAQKVVPSGPLGRMPVSGRAYAPADPNLSAPVVIGGKTRTLTKALTELTKNADNSTKDAFIKRVFSLARVKNAGSLTIDDVHRAALLKRALNLVSTANVKMDDGFDVENLVYEGNSVRLDSEGQWYVDKGSGIHNAAKVSEFKLRENWAHQTAKNLGFKRDIKFSGDSQHLGAREFKLDISGHEVVVDDEGRFATTVDGVQVSGNIHDVSDTTPEQYIAVKIDEAQALSLGRRTSALDDDGLQLHLNGHLGAISSVAGATMIFKKDPKESASEFIARIKKSLAAKMKIFNDKLSSSRGLDKDFVAQAGVSIADEDFVAKLDFISRHNFHGLSPDYFANVFSLAENGRTSLEEASGLLNVFDREYHRALAAQHLEKYTSFSSSSRQMVEAVKNAPEEFVHPAGQQRLTGYVQLFGEKGSSRETGIMNLFGFDKKNKIEIVDVKNNGTIIFRHPVHPEFKVYISPDNHFGVKGPGKGNSWGLSEGFILSDIPKASLSSLDMEEGMRWIEDQSIR